MVVWGGYGGGYLNSGGRYDPIADSWSPTSTSGAPSARSLHTAVWSGNRMIVWGGGTSSADRQNTGGRYDPASDTWLPTSLVNAPLGRYSHTAVWAGDRMIIWGGNTFPLSNSGGMYFPASDTWSATSTTGAPAIRTDHTAVWSGAEMIVWGGKSNDTGSCPPFVFFNSGGRYNPATNTWLPLSGTPPEGRIGHTAIWSSIPGFTGMIVWGGYYDIQYAQPCAPIASSFPASSRYDPASDTWVPVTSLSAPSARAFHTAVSTPDLMLIWGGTGPGGNVNPSRPSRVLRDGGRLLMASDYDGDGDGFSVCGGDCNDNNPAVHPGAIEVCDGVDNNCNGLVDEGFDQDGDGFTTCAGDCNDGNPGVHPGAAEACNQIDDDCDGLVDEDFDSDGDGRPGCGQDCDDQDATVWTPAAEVAGLAISSSLPTQITWNSQAVSAGPQTTYFLGSGSFGPGAGIDFSTSDCLLFNDTGNAVQDDRPDPGLGHGFWFLAAAANNCGWGTYGADSGGAERQVANCP